MSTKSKNTSIILAISICLFLLLLVIGIFVYDTIVRVNRGWGNNDTINYVFFTFIAISGSSMIVSLNKYLVSKNKNVIFVKNDFYRLFMSYETNGTIKNYENYLTRKQKNYCLKRISNILSTKNAEVSLTDENIFEYFSKKYGLYNGSSRISLLKEIRVNRLFERYQSEKCYEYEIAYRNVHSGELISVKNFPIYDVLLPVVFGFIGLFATIYQTLSVDGGVSESLFEYLKLFGSMMIFAFLYSLLSLRSIVDDELKKRNRELNDLKSVCLE